MTIKSQTLTSAVAIGLCTAALSLLAPSASANYCMHGKGYHAKHTPYGMYHGYGPKWGHGYKYGYGMKPYWMGHRHMYGYGRGMHGGSYGKNNSQSEAQAATTESKDLVDTAIASGNFNTLIKALEAADLKDLLKSEGPYTIFAPTDEAFAKLPAGKLDELLSDKVKLTAVLKYHVVPGKMSAADILQAQDIETAEGQILSIDKIEVAKADVETSNGMIHIVDSVLVPKL